MSGGQQVRKGQGERTPKVARATIATGYDRGKSWQITIFPDVTFFFGSLLAGAIPSGGYGTVKSLRAMGYKPYYDKLNVAAIGCGGQGGRILTKRPDREHCRACDVDDQRAAQNFERYAKQPKYTDFRVMLEKEGKNIDACTIGIPDTCMRRRRSPACRLESMSISKSR